MKRILLIVLACATVAALTLRPAEAEPTLGIGSKAPALDIEHYVHGTDGKLGPVTKFEKDKVYVVEFWATWCGPCLMSMPHLADIQNKYRDQGVQIIGISDESLDEVKALMGRQHPQAGKSFADITSAYTLTTDPDLSSYEDYMTASGNTGVPTAFLVGKTGLIEWIGHAMTIDEPLEAVLNDKWDREAFKEQLKLEKQFEEDVQQFAQLAGRGRLEEASAMLEEKLAAATNEEIKMRWTMVRHRFRMMTGKADETDFAFYREDLQARADEPLALVEFARSIFGLAQDGANVGPLATEAGQAITKIVTSAEKDLQPLLYNSLTQMKLVDDDLEGAIDAAEKAVEVAEGRQKKRLMTIVDELKSGLKKQEAAEEISGENAEEKDASEE